MISLDAALGFSAQEASHNSIKERLNPCPTGEFESQMLQWL